VVDLERERAAARVRRRLVGGVRLDDAHLDVDREAARPLEPAAVAVVAAHGELRARWRGSVNAGVSPRYMSVTSMTDCPAARADGERLQHGAKFEFSTASASGVFLGGRLVRDARSRTGRRAAPTARPCSAPCGRRRRRGRPAPGVAAHERHVAAEQRVRDLEEQRSPTRCTSKSRDEAGCWHEWLHC
jgi:hypothetical protein